MSRRNLLQSVAARLRDRRNRNDKSVPATVQPPAEEIDTTAIDHEIVETQYEIRGMVDGVLKVAYPRDEMGRVIYADIDRSLASRLREAVYSPWIETQPGSDPPQGYPEPATEPVSDQGPLVAGFHGEPEDPEDFERKTNERRTPIDKVGDKARALAANPPGWMHRLMGA